MKQSIRKNRAPVKSMVRELEDRLAGDRRAEYILRLYVSGSTPRSARAIANIKRICHNYLEDGYQLEVIDIYQQPTLMRGEQIIAAPTLVKKLPLPLRRFIGDLSDSEKLLIGLDLIHKESRDAIRRR